MKQWTADDIQAALDEKQADYEELQAMLLPQINDEGEEMPPLVEDPKQRVNIMAQRRQLANEMRDLKAALEANDATRFAKREASRDRDLAAMRYEVDRLKRILEAEGLSTVDGRRVV